MAYVAITKDLISLINGRIEKMRDAERATIPDAHNLLKEWTEKEETKELLEARLWQPVVELQQQLHQYSRKDNAHLRVLVDDRTVGRTVPLRIPCIYHRDSQYDSYVTKIDLPEDFNDITARIAEANRNYIEATNRWQAVAEQVKEFLSNCKSLNEAVKLWPDVIRYVPPKHRERLEAKTEKAERTSNALDALRKLDLDTINTSTVLARMAGASA